jgi:hypothetical protein
MSTTFRLDELANVRTGRYRLDTAPDSATPAGDLSLTEPVLRLEQHQQPDPIKSSTGRTTLYAKRLGIGDAVLDTLTLAAVAAVGEASPLATQAMVDSAVEESGPGDGTSVASVAFVDASAEAATARPAVVAPVYWRGAYGDSLAHTAFGDLVYLPGSPPDKTAAVVKDGDSLTFTADPDPGPLSEIDVRTLDGAVGYYFSDTPFTLPITVTIGDEGVGWADDAGGTLTLVADADGTDLGYYTEGADTPGLLYLNGYALVTQPVLDALVARVTALENP